MKMVLVVAEHPTSRELVRVALEHSGYTVREASSASEALLELITPPYADFTDTLAFLHDVQQFFYDGAHDETLLATSMPCGIVSCQPCRPACALGLFG